MKEINMENLTYLELEDKFKELNLLDKKEVKFKAGQMGMLLFSRLIDSELEKQNIKQPHSFLSNVDFEENTNSMEYAMYQFYSGLKVTIDFDRTLDNGSLIKNSTLYLQN